MGRVSQQWVPISTNTLYQEGDIVEKMHIKLLNHSEGHPCMQQRPLAGQHQVVVATGAGL